VFGGKYMTDCGDEFPASWFKHAKLASGPRDRSLNYFGGPGRYFAVMTMRRVRAGTW
jgi:hypothetical protein